MKLGDRFLFKGYSLETGDSERLLLPGDECIVVGIADDVGVTVRRVPRHPHPTSKAWVLREELQPLQRRTGNDPRPDAQAVLRIMADKVSRQFTELRDRVAYVFVTGSHPTNLRPFYTGALNVLSTVARMPSRYGPLRVDWCAIHELDIRNHPSVTGTKRLLSEGWELVISSGPNKRRSYQNLYFKKNDSLITLKCDGSIRPGWK